MDNGHAQAGTGHRPRVKARFPRIRLKDMLQKFLRHADPGVLDRDLVFAVFVRRLFGQPYGDRRARFAVFERIGQQIVEDLGQACRIAQHHAAVQVADQNQLLLLLLGLMAEEVDAVLHAFLQIHGVVIERNLALLHAGNLEHIVDEVEHLPAGALDFVQRFAHLVRLIHAVLRQFGQAR